MLDLAKALSRRPPIEPDVSICDPEEVRISGETTARVRGDRTIGIRHCRVCGCGTHWQSLGEDSGKMGVNARLLDDFDESAVEVRKFDNAGQSGRGRPLP